MISILHSGDKYSNKNVLNFVSKNFINSKIDVLFASTKILKNNKVHRVYQGKKVTIRDLKYGLSPPHLSTFVRWKIQKKIGMYNEKFSIASDFKRKQ